ncbi:MAG: HD domain-containing phosphohydrolase [Planctomycetota bacterium]
MTTASAATTSQNRLTEFLQAWIELAHKSRTEGPTSRRAKQAHRKFLEAMRAAAAIPGIRDRGVVVTLEQNRLLVDGVPQPSKDLRWEHFGERLRQVDAFGFALELPVDPAGLPELLDQIDTSRGQPRLDTRGLRWLSESDVLRRKQRDQLTRERRSLLMNFPELEIDVDLYNESVELLAAVSQETVGVHENVDEVVVATAEIVDRVLGRADSLLPMITLPYYERSIYYHTFNVFLMVLRSFDKLITDRETLRRIGHATLLFDIGKSCLPEGILDKTGPLTQSEAERVMEHPVTGALLLTRHPGIDPLAVNVAFGHHIKDNGAGYPQVSPDYRIDAVTRMVQVADIFEALIARRPHKRAMTGPEAYDVLFGLPNMSSFQGEMKMLQRGLGLHPPGSRVRLPDGRIALVVGDGERANEIQVRSVQETATGAVLGAPEWVRVADEAGEGAVALDPEAELDLLEARR